MAAPTKEDIGSAVTFDYGGSTDLGGRLRKYIEESDNTGTRKHYAVEPDGGDPSDGPTWLTPANNVQKA